MDRQDVQDNGHRTVTARRDVREGQQEEDRDTAFARLMPAASGVVVSSCAWWRWNPNTSATIAKSV